MTTSDVLEAVARRVVAAQPGHPVRVGVDGDCGSGKTTFARALAAAVSALGRPAIELDSDGFHHVRAVRRRRTDDPARGYYDDAYDLDALRRLVLEPLGPGGSLRYATHVHDLETDEVDPRFAVAKPDAVLVCGVTFLQRGALREAWDEVVWLDVPPEVAAERGVARDAAALGGADAARAAYRARYAAACRIYRAEEAPRDRASIVVDNTDPAAPVLLRV